LYEFSQVNNNEMGIALSRADDNELYREAYEEAQRIIRISDEVRMSLEKVVSREDGSAKATKPTDDEESTDSGKLTSSKMAKKLGLETQAFLDRMVKAGNLEIKEGKHFITDKARATGIEFRVGKKFGSYFLWPATLSLD
ncbi:MAG: DNA repair protein, partial [Pseudohongiella sp.]|nr:DNA repair protein [Pseudohongiella sp.]